MINCGSTWNLLLQLKVQEFGLKGSNNVLLGLKTLNGNKLITYQKHTLSVKVKDLESQMSIVAHNLLGADMAGVIIILGLPWLNAINPNINWPDQSFTFRKGSEGQYLPSVKNPHRVLILNLPYRGKDKETNQVSNSNINPEGPADANSTPDISLVGWNEIKLLCDSNNMQAFLIDWSKLEDGGTKEPLIRAVIRGVLVAKFTKKDPKIKSNTVKLPVEYSDFADVFSKTNADKLSPHSQHDMAIETEEGKIPPFGPTYNLLKIEIGVLQAYVEDIVEKSFITLSKSPSGAPVIFVKKKNGGLHLCVDY